jgi:uncharacterized membrane protein SirB2
MRAMPAYESLKALHVGAVVASGAFFALRGAWMLSGSPLLAVRWVRVLPHVVDTVLLASAIAMAVMAGISPLAHPWLAAKIGALLVYILLGSVALKRGKTRSVRVVALAGALAVFAYIVSVALTRNPAGPIAALAGG